LDDVAEEESFRPRAHSVERISRAKIKSVKQVSVFQGFGGFLLK
jgi:hypothetical protein